jgi:hypothetical protein
VPCRAGAVKKFEGISIPAEDLPSFIAPKDDPKIAL